MTARLLDPQLTAALFGFPNRLGTITASTTAATNASTEVPFATAADGLAGRLLVLVPDAACTIKGGPSGVAAVATDYALEAGKPFPLNMPSGYPLLSVRGSGAVNVAVYELL